MKSHEAVPNATAFLASVRNMGYSFNTAIADIIDNCLSAEADIINIQYRWNEGAPWIAVIDNGLGMNEDTLFEAMQFGSKNPNSQRGQHELGRFGLGLKTASLSQCTRLTVSSQQTTAKTKSLQWDFKRIIEGATSAWSVDELEAEDISKNPVLENLLREHLANFQTGTIVLWQCIDSILQGCNGKRKQEEKFNEVLAEASSYAQTIFHRFINPGPGIKACQISFNDSRIDAISPFGNPGNDARTEYNEETIKFNGSRISMIGYVLPHASMCNADEYRKHAGEDGYLMSQGFYIYRNKRLIEKATWFRLRKKDEKSKLVRIRVDLPNTLDQEFRLDVAKSKVVLPPPLKKEFRRIVDTITPRATRVTLRKPTRIKRQGISPIWQKNISGNSVVYDINHEHHILADLLADLDQAQRTKLKLILSIISEGFPQQDFYNDYASDNKTIKFAGAPTEEQLNAIKIHIAFMKESGIDDETIRELLLKTEIPNISEEIITSIINS